MLDEPFESGSVGVTAGMERYDLQAFGAKRVYKQSDVWPKHVFFAAGKK